MRRRKYTDEQLREAIKKSICFSDVTRYLGMTPCTYTNKQIVKRCNAIGLRLDHFDLSQSRRRNKVNHTIDTVFTLNSTVCRSIVRRMAKLHANYRGLCEECGQGEVFNGKALTIELDHINGDHTDNRLSNLRWLCPNCHSQTPTFRKCNK